MYFDSHVRVEHFDKLREALQEQLEPAFTTQLRLLAAEQLAGFDKDLTVALVEQPHGFSAAAQQATAAALQGFDSNAEEYLIAGTDLTGAPLGWKVKGMAMPAEEQQGQYQSAEQLAVFQSM